MGCSYTFDPSTPTERDDQSCYVEDHWSCPHETYEDAERCLFHLDPSARRSRGVDSAEVSDALQRLAETDGKRDKQVLGATFTDIDWGYDIITSEDNHPLDLRHATIRGSFSLDRAEIDLSLDLRGAEIGGVDWTEATLSDCLLSGGVVSSEFTVTGAVFQSDVDFTGVRFKGPVDANETRFRGDSCLQATVFEQPASFDGVEFQGDANLLDDDACFETAQFRDTVSFTKAEFRYADFVGCQFDGAASFDETTFTGDAEFAAATFETAASFQGVSFEGDADVLIDDADFSGVSFGGTVDFEHATFATATFETAVFDDEAVFDDVVFESETTFAEAVFETDVRFVESRFRGDADFTGVGIGGDAEFTGVEFLGGDNSDDDDLTFQGAEISGVADFAEARFRFANFESLTVERARFPDAVFSGDAVFTAATFEDRLELDETRFKGDTTFADARFRAPVSARGVEFDGNQNAGNDDITFAGATFDASVDFSLGEFGNADFSDVGFGTTDFSDVVFREEVAFAAATFGGPATFDEVHFRADTTFANARFDDSARFRGAEFHGRDNVDDDDVTFSGVQFTDDADFLAAEFRYADFSAATFDEHATFTEAVFADDALFVESTFAGPVSFDEARFQDDAAFDSVSVTADATFRGVEFQGGANVVDDDISFVGASFTGAVDCTAAEFGYTDFTETEIEGQATFSEAVFTDAACFDAVRFGDDVSFDEVRFRDDSSFNSIHVAGAASFRGTEFYGGANVVEDDLSVADGTFEGDVDFLGAQFRYASFAGVTISGSATFDETTFEREAVFSGVKVEGPASFEESRFRDDAAFDETSFETAVSFSGAEFHGGDNIRDEDVTFEAATFGGRVDFTHAEFEDATFREIHVVGDCVFEATTFGDKSSFVDASFESPVCFEESTFEDDTTFAGSSFDASASFYGVEFEGGPSEEYDADFEGAAFNATVDFQEIECADFGFDDVAVSGAASFTESAFGFVSVETTAFGGPVDFSFTTCTDRVTFAEASFADEVEMTEIRLEGDASFAAATFEAAVSFRGAEFSGGAHTIDDADFEAAVFGDTVDFKMAEFRFANFAGAEFDGNAIFVETRFAAGGLFQRAEFDASALFARTVFADETDFSSTLFADSAYFDEVQFRSDTTFADAVFKADATFESTEFAGNSNRHSDDANFESATFEGNADFTDVSVRYANFTNTEFGEAAGFSGLDVADAIVFRPQPVDGGETVVDLRSASLAGGVLGQPESGRVFYDLTGGSIAAVRLDDTHCDLPLFDHFRFADTDFEGFDFTSHKAYLAENNWVIHEFAAQSNRDTGDGAGIENPATLENTYLKAKNSAADFGDRKAAAEFFIKEMLYRRKKNWHIATGQSVGSIATITPRNRLRSFGKWIGNHVLYQTCGYGERLWRVLYVSAAVILFWGLVYTLIPDGVEGNSVRSVESLAQLASPEGLVILGRNIYFSTATFITLEYVGASPAGITRWIASMEAFTGALLIALVVFVLGRRVAW